LIIENFEIVERTFGMISNMFTPQFGDQSIEIPFVATFSRVSATLGDISIAFCLVLSCLVRSVGLLKVVERAATDVIAEHLKRSDRGRCIVAISNLPVLRDCEGSRSITSSKRCASFCCAIRSTLSLLDCSMDSIDGMKPESPLNYWWISSIPIQLAFVLVQQE
jgi:hypothetical protein